MIALRIFALSLAAALTLSDAAFAQTALDTARKWGLIGDWSVACAKPPSPENAYISYVARDGRLVYRSATLKDSAVAGTATSQPDGTIRILVNVTWLGHTREIVYAKSADGRIQAQSNLNVATGEYTVRGAKLLSNGYEMGWHSRCK